MCPGQYQFFSDHLHNRLAIGQRFGNKMTGAALQRRLTVFRQVARGQHRDNTIGVNGLHLFGKIRDTAPLHIDFRQNQIRSIPPDLSQRILSVKRLLHADIRTVSTDQLSDQTAMGVVTIDQ
jgi:hypothetical protein